MEAKRLPFVRDLVLVPLSVTLYAVMLHWIYRDVIQPRFSYTGYRYEEAVPEIVGLVWFATVAVTLSLPRKMTSPSSFALWTLFIVVVAPAMLMTPYLGYLDQYEGLWASVGVGVAFLVAVFGVKRRAPIEGLKLSVSPTSFWLFIWLFSIVVYGYMYFTVGLSLEFVSLLDVYDVREEYARSLGGAGVLGYLLTAQANVVNPIVLARGVMTRRWSLVALAILGQALLYSATGFKTILFSVPAILIVAFLHRRRSAPSGLVLFWGAAGGVVVAALVDLAQNGFLWSSLFARRFLITPAWLTNIYVDFYGERPKEMLAHSVLAPWVQPVYEYAPPRTISLYINGDIDTSMNANFLADGFAHFGYFGMIGAAVVLALYLRFMDRAALGLPAAVAAMVMVMPAIALSNTSILTAMLSHGLVVALFFLAVAPRDGWSKRVAVVRDRRRVRV